MAEIVVLNGMQAGTVFVLPDIPTVVGRSPESHLQIGDPWISSMHAMFERRGEDIWVVDLDSRNGTFIGDERVAEGRVPDGGIVRFGKTEARVKTARAAPGDETQVRDEPARAGREPQRDTLRADATLSTSLSRNSLVRERQMDPFALAPRAATVLRMVIDADGIADLTGAPDRLRAAMDGAVRAANEAGGVVARLAGAGILALFGLTDRRPEDATRALDAARKARRAVRAQGGLDLRAAVDVGPVIAGNTGSAGAFELAALGSAAERAERLVAHARRGEILAGPGAAGAGGLERVGLASFGELEVEVFRLKGE